MTAEAVTQLKRAKTAAQSALVAAGARLQPCWRRAESAAVAVASPVIVGLAIFGLAIFGLGVLGSAELSAQGLPVPATIAAPASGQTSGAAGAAANPAAGQFGTIGAIDVRGNRRVDRQAILSYMQIKVGDPFDPSLLNEGLKRLVATTLFLDVTLERSGSTLVVQVLEQRVINRIAFEGNNKIKDEELLSEIQLRPRQPFTKSKVQEAVRRILSLYQAQGRFATEVEPKIIVLEQNRADLVFEIIESNPSKIVGINFVGNRKYSDTRLRQVVLSREDRFWRFANAMVNYDPTRVAVDTELLTKFYRQNGFADVKVVDSVGELTTDRAGFYLTFTIEEGLRYRVGAVDFDNKISRLDTGLLARRNKVREGRYLNEDRVRESVEKMVEAANENGAPFAKVGTKLERDKAAQTIALTYVIEDGPRAFVERINITGNERTRDYVIRRRIGFEEGDAFNLTKLKRAQRNIQRLGFFSKVEIEPTEGQAEDRVVINANVAETSTATFEVGGSYSNASGFGANFSLNQRNFLGRGQKVGVSANLAQNNKAFSFSFTEPYLAGWDVSAGLSGGFSEVNNQDSGYLEQTYSAGVFGGYELINDLTQSWRYNFAYSSLQQDSTSAIISDEGSTTTRSSLSHSITYDVRDNPANPSEGWVAGLTTEIAGLGGDVAYLKNSAKGGFYYAINDNFTLAFEGEGGWLQPFNDEGTYVADRFTMGALQVRGFARSGIGPIASDTLQRVGGSKYYRGTAELRFPIPLPVDLDIKGRVFTDVGALWDVNTTFGTAQGVTALNDTADPRLSIGYGLTWASPIGPLQLDFGYAMRSQASDDKQVFRFNIQRGF